MDYINLHAVLASVVFAVLGIVILVLSFLVVEKLTPENLWKEVVANKNIAMAIVLGAYIIAIGMIVSAAIHG